MKNILLNRIMTVAFALCNAHNSYIIIILKSVCQIKTVRDVAISCLNISI